MKHDLHWRQHGNTTKTACINTKTELCKLDNDIAWDHCFLLFRLTMSSSSNDDHTTPSRTVKVNQYSGYYETGVAYSIAIKRKIADIIQRHQVECFPNDIVIIDVALEAGVSRHTVYNIIQELEEEGEVIDPQYKKKLLKKCLHVVCGMLTPEHEHYLLALRADNPARPKKDYVKCLFEAYDLIISESSVTNFFLWRFDHAGNFTWQQHRHQQHHHPILSCFDFD